MQELRTDRYKLKELFPEKAKKYAQKLKTKATELEFIRKGIPIDPKDIEIKEGERAAIRLVTTPHLDRDGEILMPHGAMLDDFRQSPSVLYAHDYKGLPVGHDQWIKPVYDTRNLPYELCHAVPTPNVSQLMQQHRATTMNWPMDGVFRDQYSWAKTRDHATEGPPSQRHDSMRAPQKENW